jgi:hypothetical protein
VVASVVGALAVTGETREARRRVAEAERLARSTFHLGVDPIRHDSRFTELLACVGLPKSVDTAGVQTKGR